MKTILLDTNFLITSYLYRIDIFEEIKRIIPEAHEIVTPSGVIKELKTIQKKASGSDKLAAGVALNIITKGGVRVIESRESEKNVDEFLVKFTVGTGGVADTDKIVCTNDKELKDRLKKRKVSVICTRGKNQFMLY